MSTHTELEIPKSTGSKHQKRSKEKSRDKSERKSEKKRKRDATNEDQESSPRKKKHRSHKSPKPITSPSKPQSVNDSVLNSPFHAQTSSLYLPLSPISQYHPLRGLCAEHLSPLILTYYPPFNGVVLSYSNPRLSEDPRTVPASERGGTVLARSIDEYAVSFVWVIADFLIFKPQRRGWIEGWINLQSEGHIGLVCWNLFNASIERKRLPKGWKWIPGGMEVRSRRKHSNRVDHVLSSDEEEHEAVNNGAETSEGHFEDAEGNKVEGALNFRVRDVETSPGSDRERGFMSIEGTLLGEGEEELTAQGNSRNGERSHDLFSRHKKSDRTISIALLGNDRARHNKAD